MGWRITYHHPITPTARRGRPAARHEESVTQVLYPPLDLISWQP